MIPVAVILSGCAALRGVAGGGVQSPTPSEAPSPTPSGVLGGIIPWIDAKPTGFHQGLASPVGDGLPRLCRGAELTASYGGAMGLTGGHLEGTVNFVNRSATPCALGGVPIIQLISGGGETIPTSAWTDPRFASTPVILEPRPFSPPDGPQGIQIGDAFTTIEWSLYDPGAGSCGRAMAVASVISVGIPGGGGAVSAPAVSPRNDGPLTFCPPRLGVGAFQASVPQPGASPAPTVPQRYWSATLAVPSHARVGHALQYEVTVTNVFYRALAFPNGCPGYLEALEGPASWTSGKELFLLNCGPAGTIEPGASARFAMTIEVPQSAPPGKYSLIWELDIGLLSYGASMADVTITAS